MYCQKCEFLINCITQINRLRDNKKMLKYLVLHHQLNDNTENLNYVQYYQSLMN